MSSSVRCICLISRAVASAPCPCASPLICRRRARTSKKLQPGSCRRPPFRRRARVPSSRRTARSSLCPPKRATCATSPARPPSPIGIRRGRPTARPSLISPTKRVNTRFTSAIRPVSAPYAKSILGRRPRFSTTSAGPPTASRLPTATNEENSGYSISPSASRCSSTVTCAVAESRLSGRLTASGSPTSSSCRTTIALSLSIRSRLRR